MEIHKGKGHILVMLSVMKTTAVRLDRWRTEASQTFDMSTRCGEMSIDVKEIISEAQTLRVRNNAQTGRQQHTTWITYMHHDILR